MDIPCGGCRHFVDEPHDGYWGYCTFVPPATLAAALGLDHQDSMEAASVVLTDTCSLASKKGDHE